jgi:FkbM family methyltransferase
MPPINWSYELRMLAGLLGNGRSRRLREYAWRVLQRNTSVVLVDGPAGRFLVHTGDWTIGRSLFVSGQFDLAQMDRIVGVLIRELGPRLMTRTFVDVGANIGTTTVAALTRYGFPRGMAFEPEERNVELLRHNVLLNDVADRVELHPVAVSSAAGTAALARSHDNHGDHRIVMDGDPQVTLVALDDVLDGDAAFVLWIDTQGHEGHVLSGAEALLSRGTPTVAEFWPSLLRGAGTLDLFAETVTRHYERVIDMGAPHECRPPRELEPSQLLALADELPDDHFHDLVLLPRGI